jgi:hypothetical protein
MSKTKNIWDSTCPERERGEQPPISCAELKAAYRQVKRLVKMLKRYGRHEPGCLVELSKNDPARYCSCGFEDVLREKGFWLDPWTEETVS